jgi:AraC-like DNA-binding protein
MSEATSTIDPLGDVLHLLRMSDAFYSRCEFSAPWGLELPELPGLLMFHVVMSGPCWLEVAGNEPRLLQPGDLALAPHGAGHRLASAPGVPGAGLFDLPRAYLGEHYELLRQGGGGAPATLICGVVRFDDPTARHLIDSLPAQIIVEAERSPQVDWLLSTLRFIATEARRPRPGGETVITRLADVLVILAIRAWLEQDPLARTGWLGALRDPQIGRAITLILRDPARDWTVAALASELAMSRSAFAARFNALVGEPPMHYVTRWRMLMALTWLREEGATVGELALRLGYQSEAAFSRAFKRWMGVSPGEARRVGETRAYPAATVPAADLR